MIKKVDCFRKIVYKDERETDIAWMFDKLSCYGICDKMQDKLVYFPDVSLEKSHNCVIIFLGEDMIKIHLFSYLTEDQLFQFKSEFMKKFTQFRLSFSAFEVFDLASVIHTIFNGVDYQVELIKEGM